MTNWGLLGFPVGSRPSQPRLDVPPPGFVLDYIEGTSIVSVGATAEGSSTIIITGNPITFDGVTRVKIEFGAPVADCTNNSAFQVCSLWEDGVEVGRMTFFQQTGGSYLAMPLRADMVRTPVNGTHIYSIRAFKSGAGSNVYGGTGGVGGYNPMFLRVSIL